MVKDKLWRELTIVIDSSTRDILYRRKKLHMVHKQKPAEPGYIRMSVFG